MTAEESAIPLSPLVTRFDVTVIVCHRMGARRSEGASTGASDPNRRGPPSSAAVQRGMRGGSSMPESVNRRSWGW
jgi:hypothetical protein